MPQTTGVVPPWQSPLTFTEHSLVYYGVVTAGLALLAMLVRTWATRGEVGGRYRPAIVASAVVVTVAFLSYALLLVKLEAGYVQRGDVFVPTDQAVWAWAARYMDWSVTVPLLVVELVVISTLRGAVLRRTRAIGVGAAFLMIATGYLGGVAVDQGRSFTALLVWGLISSVFFVVLYVLILTTVLRSLPFLPAAARPTYRAAMVVLMATWFVYPVVFGLQGFTSGGAWATAGQLLLCTADVIAKVGFGLLIHKVAKLRTAFDVEAGIDTHPETLWVDGDKQSDAIAPAQEPLRSDLRSAGAS